MAVFSSTALAAPSAWDSLSWSVRGDIRGIGSPKNIQTGTGREIAGGLKRPGDCAEFAQLGTGRRSDNYLLGNFW